MRMTYTCDRPKCQNAATDSNLYCSEVCFELDNDPNPIQPIARYKSGGFGYEISRMVREPVRLPVSG
jgi:hypothetical protein